MQRPDNKTIAIIAGLALLVILIAVYFATRNEDQDRLGDYATIANAAAPEDTAACGSQRIYDTIKAELFRRAAEIRGEDRDAYARIAEAAFARMENATAEGEADSSGIVNCTGSLSLDLPPGLEATGGRHRLMANVDYSVDAKAGRAVSLRNADALVNSLAGLARIDATPNQPLFPQGPAGNDETGIEDAPIAGEGPTTSPPVAAARPSFECSRARSGAERAVCSDAGLADLDRAMAAEYARALSASDERQAYLLRRTGERFLEYRENCPNAACIDEAYTGRIREIRDIMAGRWRQPR